MQKRTLGKSGLEVSGPEVTAISRHTRSVALHLFQVPLRVTSREEAARWSRTLLSLSQWRADERARTHGELL